MPSIQFLVSHNNDTALYQWKVSSLEELESSIRRDLNSISTHFTISYFDDEGDQIKITSQPEFHEAMEAAKENGKFLSIIITEKEQEPSPVASEEEPKSSEEAPRMERPVSDYVNFLGSLFGGNGVSSNHFSQRMEEFAQNISPFLDNISPMVENGLKELKPVACQLGREVEQAFDNLNEELERVAEEESVPAPEEPKSAPEEPKAACDSTLAMHHAICDVCDEMIRGIRYKCLHCADYDMCEACEAKNLEQGSHDASHVFAKLRRPDQRMHYAFPRGGNGGCRRGKFGGRGRIAKLEKDVAALQQQMEELLAKKAEAQPVPEPVQESEVEDVHEDASEAEDVLEDASDDEVVIEDVPEEEHAAQEPTEVVDSRDGVQTILDLLHSMGFNDDESNLVAIHAHDCNVEETLEALLNSSF